MRRSFGELLAVLSCVCRCRLYAVHLGREEIAAALLTANADPNATSRSGDTALHWASYKGLYNTAELLIQNAANLEAVGELGNRPLHLAAAADRTQVIGVVFWGAVWIADGVRTNSFP